VTQKKGHDLKAYLKDGIVLEGTPTEVRFILNNTVLTESPGIVISPDPLTTPVNRKFMLWTSQDSETVKRMALTEKKSLPEIATALGRTELAIYARLRTLGIDRSSLHNGPRKRRKGKRTASRPHANLPWKSNDLRTLKRLHLEGNSPSVIGKALGRTPKGITSRIHILKQAGEIEA
jgi:hypothetical protein